MVFFFLAFSMNWYTPGVTAPNLVVGVVTLVVFVMIVVSIMRTKEGHHWWPMTLELLSNLANVLKPGKEAQRDAEEISLTPMNPSEVNVAADDPTHSTTHLATDPHFPTSTAPVHLPQQSNGGNSMLHSPHSHTSPSLLLGEGYSLHNREDTPTISQVQPTGEARGEVATDSGAATVSPGLLRAEEGENVECMFEEPDSEEVKIPRVEDSTTSLPMFRGRGSTGDDFHYMRQADDQDIMEIRDK